MVHDLRWHLKTQVAVPRVPIVVQLFIVNIINQHLDLCLLVRGHGVRLPTSRAAGHGVRLPTSHAAGHGVRLPTSRAAGRKELDTNGEDSGSG